MLTPGLLIFIQEVIGENASETAGRSSVFEHIALWCEVFIDQIHYPGVFILMMLESMIAPIPSEAVMPFAGFLAQQGKMSMVLIGIVSTAGSIAGSLVSYWMGMYGGRPLVMKVGKYLLLNVQHLDATERFFNRHGGGWTIFICRFIPVVRHFISIPAGMGRMPLPTFIILTAIGACIWNMFLAGVGYWMKENWTMLRDSDVFHYIDLGILIAIILVVLTFIIRQIVEWRAQKLGKTEGNIDDNS